MSAAQSRIYILGSLMNDPTAYSLMIRYDIEDTLDIDRLRNALTTTMQHHECLRTCFFARPGDNQPTQGLLSFPVRRFKHVPHATNDDIANALEAARTKVWDIEHGETLSLTVLSRDSQKHVLVLGYHHIILDASGMRRFIRDLNDAYHHQSLKMDYGTCIGFARQEQESLQSGALEGRMQYWRNEFSPLPEVLPLLPMAKTSARPETQKVATVHASRVIEEDTVAVVKRACQTLGVTAFQFYLAVGQVLLTQSLGIDDLCVGVADANRPDAAYMDTVGFFLNLVPVRFRIPAGTTFAEVAQNTSQQMGHALEKSVPFDMLLDQLNTARSSSHTPLFQVLVNYRLAMNKSVPFGGSYLNIVDGEEGRNPYDITLSFLESQSEGLGVTIDCSESLYDVDGTEKLLDMYMGLLEEIIQNLNVKVDECQIYNPGAVSSALKIGQGKRLEVKSPPTVAERFQAIQRAYPERIAARDRSSDLTYQQLATRVNSIAAAIQDAGHGAHSCIAVLCEPSNEFVASILAILHIGAVYVPLDIGLPSSRHTEMISSCHPSLIICHETTRDAADTLVVEGPESPAILALEDIDHARDPVPCAAKPDSPAFILYTSGTTGKPKGVVLAQRGVSSWLEHTIPEYALDASPTTILQQSALSFDMSLIQIFCALCSGGTLLTAPQEARRDPVRLTQLIREHGVNWTFAVPSEYMLWLQYGRDSLRQCRGYRQAMVGGETFPDQLKREIRRLELPGLRVSNNYGPTEITFTATSQPWPLEAEDRTEPGAPIGKPHPNYSICVLDAKGRPLPVGFRGEVCIGGPGVALGYWDMPGETDRKFIPDPTKTTNDEELATAGRWYRTGDQGWLAPDGTVMFVGRLGGDTQVKLRGLRIELAEVEGALLKSGESLLSAAVVTVRGGDLIAHVILDPGKKGEAVDQGTIKRRLLTGLTLPQYMHPSRVIVVGELPRASTGKIDRQAVLKMPLTANGDGASGEPNSELSLREVELKLLWSRVLPDPYQVLTADSDFFLEGGNSLRLTKLQNEIKETLGVSVSIRQLYSAPTLRQMAARIGDEYATDEDIDWGVETAIPDSLLAAAETIPRRPRTPTNKNLQVLLTGAAMVLGNAVLHALLHTPAVAKIHCIAVTPDDEAQIPTSNEKIVTYPGSLSSPALGLSPSECAALQSRVDIVIHAGAAGHCLNSYSSVRRANVESTHFLAETICLPRAVPLLYVSSQRVPAMAGLKVLPPVPVLAEPAKTGDTGYMASRWVSERFLHKLTEKLSENGEGGGFAVEVHRPCLFFGDRAPPSDALNGVLRYTRLMRTIPRFARVEGYVDVKNVDDIAFDIAASAINLASATSTTNGSNSGKGKAGIRYRHHSSGRKVTLEEWPAYMEELYGEPFETLDLPDWIARAREHGIHPLIATYLEGVVEKEELGLFPYLGEEEGS
ncbi:PKS-NRPS protein [Apiospora sp. TS-2023a]